MSLESATANMFQFATMSKDMGVANYIHTGSAEKIREELKLHSFAGFFPGALSPESRFTIASVTPGETFENICREIFSLSLPKKGREIYWTSAMLQEGPEWDALSEDEPFIVAVFGTCSAAKEKAVLIIAEEHTPLPAAIMLLQRAAWERVVREN